MDGRGWSKCLPDYYVAGLTGLVIHSTVSTWQSAAHWWAPAGPSVRKRTGNLCSTDLAQQKFQTMWHSSQDFTEMPATRSKTLTRLHTVGLCVAIKLQRTTVVLITPIKRAINSLFTERTCKFA